MKISNWTKNVANQTNKDLDLPGFTRFVAKTYQLRITRFWGKILNSNFCLYKKFDISQLCLSGKKTTKLWGEKVSGLACQNFPLYSCCCCCRWFSYRKLCERISIIQRPRCWASKISGWECQHFPLYIGLSKLKIVSRETSHPIVFLLPKGKVHQKKGRKKLTNVSFMYVCVTENGQMLVFFLFSPTIVW